MKLGTRPCRNSNLGSEVGSIDWLLAWDSVSQSKVDPSGRRLFEMGSNGGDKRRSWAAEIAALVRDSASGKSIGQLPTPHKTPRRHGPSLLRDNRFLVIAPSFMTLDGS